MNICLYEDFNNKNPIHNSITNIYIWAKWKELTKYINWIRSKGFHFGAIVMIWADVKRKEFKVLLDGYRGERGLGYGYIVRNSIQCFKIFTNKENLLHITKKMLTCACKKNIPLSIISHKTGRRFKLPIPDVDVNTNPLLNPYCLLIDENNFSDFEGIMELHDFKNFGAPVLVCFKLNETEELILYLETLENKLLTFHGLAFYLYDKIYLFASNKNLHPYDVFKSKIFQEIDVNYGTIDKRKKYSPEDVLGNLLKEKISISYIDIKQIKKKGIRNATVFPLYYKPVTLSYPSINLGEFEEIEL